MQDSGGSRDKSSGSDDPWRAINEKLAIAQTYFTQREYPHPAWEGMPWATWHKTGSRLSTAEPGEARCGAKAIDVKYFNSRVIEIATRTPVTCIRPPGHEGPHASAVRQHPIRSHLWDGCIWN